jgi:hypothetical protein
VATVVGKKNSKGKASVRSQPGGRGTPRARNRTNRFNSNGFAHRKLLSAASFLRGSRRGHHPPRYPAGRACPPRPPPGVRAKPAALPPAAPARGTPDPGKGTHLCLLYSPPLCRSTLVPRTSPAPFSRSGPHYPVPVVLPLYLQDPARTGCVPIFVAPRHAPLAPARTLPPLFCPFVGPPTALVVMIPRTPLWVQLCVRPPKRPRTVSYLQYSPDPPSGHSQAAGPWLYGGCVLGTRSPCCAERCC